LRVRKSISSGILPGKQGVLREVVLLRTLSADIHGAGASEAIFTKAKSDIEEHFEAKKLFKLVDGKEI
ncbi:MAG: hypothetical protein JW934_06015, partial [Anaerolineae bacterium]|nr:hypothetical protein [Anaerolineae bacterium]